jgi:hypothetical protein
MLTPLLTVELVMGIFAVYDLRSKFYAFRKNCRTLGHKVVMLVISVHFVLICLMCLLPHQGDLQHELWS